MIYDKVIIGAGASGLLHGALSPVKNGLILEGSKQAGQKLLLSGSGQCNITHGGNIKDFIAHYGTHGSKIRRSLYQANNLSFMGFLENSGVPLVTRKDGKVFPASMKASHVLELLVKKSEENGYKIQTESKVHSLASEGSHMFRVNNRIMARTVVIATGGCSIPGTGSDGSMFQILQQMGIEIIPPAPALTPVFVQNYPYEDLSGLSFEGVTATVDNHQMTGDLLFTHNSFSGPVILNLSRYAKPGLQLSIRYLSHWPDSLDCEGNPKQAISYLSTVLKLPKRLMGVLFFRLGIPPSATMASVGKKQLLQLKDCLLGDRFSISGTGGFKNAMATCGGVSLEEVDLKTFQCKQYPGLFIIGESLDIDGDTGGYNMQFCYSSSKSAALAYS